ncbi:MAG TPA: YceI family protein [Verrucomicrobiae bacterium]|nr:YceI family protein [Verrucomicrobiae bacterium]
MKKFFVAAGLAAALAIPALADTTTWNLDPAHSNASFVVRHLGISNVRGEFTKFTGTVQLDDADVTKSSVTASIDLASVNTRVEARDNDLRSDHFFDVAKYPTMTFQSTKVAKAADGSLKLTGNLTLHGVTKEVTFDVTGPSAPLQAMGGTRRGAVATTTIKRSDFGITYGAMKVGNGSLMVGDDVQITIDLEMVLQKAAGQ